MFHRPPPELAEAAGPTYRGVGRAAKKQAEGPR